LSGFTYTIDLKVLGGAGLTQTTTKVDKFEQSVRKTNKLIGRTEADTRSFTSTGSAGFDKVGRSALGLDNKIGKVRRSTNQARDQMDRFTGSGQRGFMRLNRGATRLIGILGGATAAFSSAREAADLESMETALDFATAGEGAKNMEFLEQTAESLKLSMRSSLPAFKNWMGAVRGTSLEGQEARNTFYAVAEASRVMGLNGEQNAGVFLALGQMASKGKVSAEELRQQLGERLPGALGIAARAMGVTQAELNNMMDKGELYSDVFLPKFARQLHKEFAGGVEEALGTANANFADFDNSVLELQQSLGGGLVPVGTRLINNFLIPAMDWLGRNSEILVVLGSLYVGAAVKTGVFAAAQAWAATSGGVLTRVMQLLNVTMSLNPVGMVVMGIAALTTAMTFAWNASDVWRGQLQGTWEAIKQTGLAILKWLVLPMRVAAKLFTAALTFDVGAMKSALGDAMGLVADNVNDFTSIGEKYGEGYAKGVADFNAKGERAAAPTALDAAFRGSGGAPAANNGKSEAAAKADAKVRSGLKGISGGGSKNITINIDSLVETLAIHAATVQEGTDDLVDLVVAKLTQGINQAQQMQ
jgi:tape measure domain-containing protein